MFLERALFPLLGKQKPLCSNMLPGIPLKTPYSFPKQGFPFFKFNELSYSRLKKIFPCSHTYKRMRFSVKNESEVFFFAKISNFFAAKKATKNLIIFQGKMHFLIEKITPILPQVKIFMFQKNVVLFSTRDKK